MYKINTTEMMVTAEPQEIITKDKLNAMVDAQIYFKVKEDEQSIKNSQYNVYNYRTQIVQLARTTLRNIIGTLDLNEANSDRNKINSALMDTLRKETAAWGIDVVRAELKEINPPKNVQDTMNKVVIAQNEKQAATDFASAVETKADGDRRAIVKVADGEREASVLKAQGQSAAFKLINESFNERAQLLRRLEVAENTLSRATKIIVPVGSSIVNVIGDATDMKVVPIASKEGKKR
jgi:regulator of protease activity HflC (stomatin/prohibitin superfamily)